MGTTRVRVVAGVAALGLLPVLAAVQGRADAGVMPAARTAAVASVGSSAAPSGRTPYRATIVRTPHGIPHITAGDFGSLGFGSGYATMRTSACTLADVLITARGARSRWLGADKRYDDRVSMAGTNLQSDALVTDLHDRRVVEHLLADPVAGPGREARAMVRGYAAGVDAYLRDIGGAGHLHDRACRGKPWIRPDVRPIDIWYGVYLANILASAGHFLPQIVDATPPSPTDPGLPALASSARFARPPAVLPSRDALLKGLGKDPASPFGSNATAVGRDVTSTHRGMLLGNPHFPWVGRYRFTQQQLTIPGRYDVAGASLIGSPVVNIGWNSQVAWSHTVSTAYRFTPYEYRTVGSPTTYLTTDGLQQLDHRIVHVKVLRPGGRVGTVTEDMYRTPQGYVIDDPAELMGWTPVSFFALRDANGEQLRTIDTFLQMGRARSVRDLLHQQDAGGGMPWVNTIAADRTGHVMYADHSVVPDVSDDLADRCMTPIGRVLQQVAGLPGLDGTRATADCAWGNDVDAERPGIFGPAHLPVAFRDDWVVNANDSYWLPNPKQPLEGYARIIGCERCVRTLRTRMVYHYVLDRIAHGRVTPASLRGTEHQNRVFGGELMSQGGALVQLCRNAVAAADQGACTALARWDRHSDVGSRGNQVFEAFVSHLSTNGLLGIVPGPSIWKVPFDAADPVGTPRELDPSSSAAQDAMRAGVADLRAHHVAFDATWGSLQVAGDRGAPLIPLGGGLGDQAGNANALASADPLSHRDHYKPVSFGSSHIQAISFLDHGRVDARTILTYGQSEDPRSPWSSDQTRMFAHKRWVHFPFTAREIRRQAVSREVVTAPR
ncbi:MAG: penicillin acylase family protein [Marmoricola sp.]